MVSLVFLVYARIGCSDHFGYGFTTYNLKKGSLVLLFMN